MRNACKSDKEILFLKGDAQLKSDKEIPRKHKGTYSKR